MNLYAISGGPGTGKTTIINELAKRFTVFPEAARLVGETDPRFKGKSANETNQVDFQNAIFDMQLKQIKLIKSDEPVFSDRGLGDSIAYLRLRNIPVPNYIYIPEQKKSSIQEFL